MGNQAAKGFIYTVSFLECIVQPNLLSAASRPMQIVLYMQCSVCALKACRAELDGVKKGYFKITFVLILFCFLVSEFPQTVLLLGLLL